MRVYDLKDETGRVFAFEVDNFWLGRRGVAAVVRTIPGAKLSGRVPTGYVDEFCEFELRGERFVAYEPFGDNSRYWIGPKPPVFSERTAAIRDAFVAYVPRKWFSTVRAVALGLLVAGAIVLLVQLASGMNADAARWGKGLAASGGILLVALFMAARAGILWHASRSSG